MGTMSQSLVLPGSLQKCNIDQFQTIKYISKEFALRVWMYVLVVLI